MASSAAMLRTGRSHTSSLYHAMRTVPDLPATQLDNIVQQQETGLGASPPAVTHRLSRAGEHSLWWRPNQHAVFSCKPHGQVAKDLLQLRGFGAAKDGHDVAWILRVWVTPAMLAHRILAIPTTQQKRTDCMDSLSQLLHHASTSLGAPVQIFALGTAPQCTPAHGGWALPSPAHTTAGTHNTAWPAALGNK
jgi:hypothetical protein